MNKCVTKNKIHLWSKDEEIKFLKYYREEPVIWNKKHPNYNRRKKKYEAWVRISKKMGLSVIILKTKKDSLLSSYRKYKKCIKDSMGKNDHMNIYKPIWFAYDIMDSFLGTWNTKSITKEKSLPDEDITADEDISDENDVSKSLSTSENNVTVSHDQHHCTNTLEEYGEFITQAIDTALQKRNAREENCDLYVKILANKLRKMSETEQAEVMYEIDGIFLRRQSKFKDSCNGYQLDI